MKYFKEENNYLRAVFEFKNFSKALEFVNSVWNIAEIINHHPNIKVFDYRFVEIETTTHDAGNTITKKDLEIVKLIETSYKK